MLVAFYKSPEDVLAKALLRILKSKAQEQHLDPHVVLERLYHMRLAAEEDPNKDPMDLFSQIMPTLRLMKINNMADRGKTQMAVGATDKKGNHLYQVLLKRDSKIGPAEIDGIRRQHDVFDGLVWTSKGMIVQVWGEYVAPAGPAGPPAAP